MISKCANPECFATFRYLHEGKLFEFEVRLFDELFVEPSSASHNEKPSREIECFWLCDSCASTMTIVGEPNTHRIVIVPLQDDSEEDVLQRVLPLANRQAKISTKRTALSFMGNSASAWRSEDLAEE